MIRKRFVILGLTILWATFDIPCFAVSHTQASLSHASLANFITVMEQTNPQIAAARAEVAAAQANAIAQGKPVYNPEISVSGQRVTNLPDENTFTVGVSQTIDLFNKRGSRFAVGTNELLLAQWRLAQVKQDVEKQVLSALVNYRIQEQQVILAQQRLQLLARFVEQVKRQFKSGDIAQDGVDQAQLAYADAITQFANATIIELNQKQQLMALTGMPFNTWPQLPQMVPVLPHLSSALFQQLLNHIPALQISNMLYKSVAAKVNVAKKDALADPTVSLIGGQQGPIQERRGNLIGLSVSIPLFVLNNYHAQIMQAHHTALAADEDRINTYRETKASLWGSYARYQQLSSALKQWQFVATPSLTTGTDLLDKLWQAGTLTTTDYLIQFKQRLDSRSNGINLRSETWMAWFEWLNASGQIEQWAKQQK